MSIGSLLVVSHKSVETDKPKRKKYSVGRFIIPLMILITAIGLMTIDWRLKTARSAVFVNKSPTHKKELDVFLK